MKKIVFNENKNIIHKQLKLARIKRKLSQKDLAAKMQNYNINIDQQMISKIENNKRIVSDYELACFSKVLQEDPSVLLADFEQQVEEYTK